MKRVAAAVSCILLGLGGCAHKPPVPSDYDVVLKQPKPSTDEARRQECTWIQTQLARQKQLATYVSTTASFPELALQHQAAAQRNMARIAGAGPLIVIDTEVDGSQRSKPA